MRRCRSESEGFKPMKGIFLTDFGVGPDTGEDLLPALKKAIEAANESPDGCEIIFENGIYGSARKPARPVVLADLPQAAAGTRVYTDKTQMLADCGIFYWEETENVESYLITAYKNDGGYKKVSSHRVYSNSGAVTGLAADTGYTVQISACDSKEKVISHYKPFTVITALQNPPAVTEEIRDSFDVPDASASGAGIVFKTLSANNSALLDANPNRGLRGCMEFYHFNLNDAELYYWDQYNSSGVYCEGYAAVLGAKQLCLTTLSGINGYYDSGIYSESCMSQWKKLPVTAEWLSFNELPYSDGWFRDSSGQTVSRNVFEYIRDFLGYRISAESLTAYVGEKSVNVSLVLKNCGFSAAFNMESELVILDGDNNAVSRVAAGSPAEWYGTAEITRSLDNPDLPGEYRIALCIRSKSGAYTRFDNGIPYENGYNIICRYTKE